MFFRSSKCLFIRVIAVFALVTYFVTTHFSSAAFASAPLNTKSAPHTKSLKDKVSEIHIPKHLGYLEETFQGNSTKTILILQDPHAIGEAQRNISDLIEHFHATLGVSSVAVEGTDERLEPLIYREYPDAKTLKKVLDHFMEKGEIPASVYAAILASKKLNYKGIESWPLYEEGIELHLESSAEKKEKLQELQNQRTHLKHKKISSYSSELLQADQAIKAFEKNEIDIIQATEKLNEFHEPAESSSIRLLIDETKDPEEVQKLTAKKLFEDFSAYSQSVKESLFQNEAQKTLDRASHLLDLKVKQIRLEMTREEWQKLKILKSSSESASNHFYQNAELREKQFIPNTLSFMEEEKTESAMLIVGGFHVPGIKQELKEKGISYAIVTPHIKQLVSHHSYIAQMQGEVSWKKNFEVQKGHISLFNAFRKTITQKLFEETQETTSVLKKAWRDRIILALAVENRLLQIDRYIGFLKEKTLSQSWSQNFEHFKTGLKKLEATEQLTAPKIFTLLKTSQIPTLSAGANILVSRRSIKKALLLPKAFPQVGKSEARKIPILEDGIKKRLVDAMQDIDLFIESVFHIHTIYEAPPGGQKGLISKLLFEVTRDNPAYRQRLSVFKSQLEKATNLFSAKKARVALQAIQTIGIGHVVMITPEMAPFSQSGGMAMVMNNLPITLSQMGVPVTVITNLYHDKQGDKHRTAKDILKNGIVINGLRVYVRKESKEVQVPMGPGDDPQLVSAEVYLAEYKGVEIKLLYHPEYTNALYYSSDDPNDSEPQIQRGVFLARGSLEIIQDFELKPNVIHANDWMAAGALGFIQTDPRYASLKNNAHLHLSIHNLGRYYQGFFDNNPAGGNDQRPHLYKKHFALKEESHYEWLADPALYGFMNFLAWGIQHANSVNTVSLPYARDSLTEAQGEQLHTILQKKGSHYYGVSNGIDLPGLRWQFTKFALKSMSLWQIVLLFLGRLFSLIGMFLQTLSRFSLQTFREKSFLESLPLFKRIALQSIQKKYGLTDDPHADLISLLGRISEQKGVVHVGDQARKILMENPQAQLLIGGPVAKGDPDAEAFEKIIEQLEVEFPGRVKGSFKWIKHDEVLEIMLASKLFLMPSKYEPGGLTQLEALAAGTLIIYHDTGGVSATVSPFDEATKKGNGFSFGRHIGEAYKHAGDAFYQAVSHALQVLRENNFRTYDKIISEEAADASNLDWPQRAALYVTMYQKELGVLDAKYPHLQSARDRDLPQIQASSESRLNPSEDEEKIMPPVSRMIKKQTLKLARVLTRFLFVLWTFGFMKALVIEGAFLALVTAKTLIYRFPANEKIQDRILFVASLLLFVSSMATLTAIQHFHFFPEASSAFEFAVIFVGGVAFLDFLGQMLPTYRAATLEEILGQSRKYRENLVAPIKERDKSNVTKGYRYISEHRAIHRTLESLFMMVLFGPTAGLLFAISIMLIHESGHWITLKIIDFFNRKKGDTSIENIRFAPQEWYVSFFPKNEFFVRHISFILFGPFANLIAAGILFILFTSLNLPGWFFLFAQLNLYGFLWNMLPASGSDGEQVLNEIRQHFLKKATLREYSEIELIEASIPASTSSETPWSFSFILKSSGRYYWLKRQDSEPDTTVQTDYFASSASYLDDIPYPIKGALVATESGKTTFKFGGEHYALYEIKDFPKALDAPSTKSESRADFEYTNEMVEGIKRDVTAAVTELLEKFEQEKGHSMLNTPKKNYALRFYNTGIIRLVEKPKSTTSDFWLYDAQTQSPDLILALTHEDIGLSFIDIEYTTLSKGQTLAEQAHDIVYALNQFFIDTELGDDDHNDLGFGSDFKHHDFKYESDPNRAVIVIGREAKKIHLDQLPPEGKSAVKQALEYLIKLQQSKKESPIANAHTASLLAEARYYTVYHNDPFSALGEVEHLIRRGNFWPQRDESKQRLRDAIRILKDELRIAQPLSKEAAILRQSRNDALRFLRKHLWQEPHRNFPREPNPEMAETFRQAAELTHGSSNAGRLAAVAKKIESGTLTKSEKPEPAQQAEEGLSLAEVAHAELTKYNPVTFKIKIQTIIDRLFRKLVEARTKVIDEDDDIDPGEYDDRIVQAIDHKHSIEILSRGEVKLTHPTDPLSDISIPFPGAVAILNNPFVNIKTLKIRLAKPIEANRDKGLLQDAIVAYLNRWATGAGAKEIGKIPNVLSVRSQSLSKTPINRDTSELERLPTEHTLLFTPSRAETRFPELRFKQPIFKGKAIDAAFRAFYAVLLTVLLLLTLLANHAQASFVTLSAVMAGGSLIFFMVFLIRLLHGSGFQKDKSIQEWRAKALSPDIMQRLEYITGKSSEELPDPAFLEKIWKTLYLGKRKPSETSQNGLHPFMAQLREHFLKKQGEPGQSHSEESTFEIEAQKEPRETNILVAGHQAAAIVYWLAMKIKEDDLRSDVSGLAVNEEEANDLYSLLRGPHVQDRLLWPSQTAFLSLSPNQPPAFYNVVDDFIYVEGGDEDTQALIHSINESYYGYVIVFRRDVEDHKKLDLDEKKFKRRDFETLYPITIYTRIIEEKQPKSESRNLLLQNESPIQLSENLAKILSSQVKGEEALRITAKETAGFLQTNKTDVLLQQVETALLSIKGPGLVDQATYEREVKKLVDILKAFFQNHPDRRFPALIHLPETESRLLQDKRIQNYTQAIRTFREALNRLVIQGKLKGKAAQELTKTLKQLELVFGQTRSWREVKTSGQSEVIAGVSPESEVHIPEDLSLFLVGQTGKTDDPRVEAYGALLQFAVAIIGADALQSRSELRAQKQELKTAIHRALPLYRQYTDQIIVFGQKRHPRVSLSGVEAYLEAAMHHSQKFMQSA